MKYTGYRGRFAPSPTGPLHLGSLVAAVGSYIRAKAKDGVWLVRIEDIDPPREEQGATENILQALTAHHLIPDEPVLFQHQRLSAYSDALSQLHQESHLYWCNCSRSSIRAALDDPYGPIVYPGTCRKRDLDSEQGRALRVKTKNEITSFDDQYIGRFEQNLRQETGDFVLRRADGLFSYQLAVVVDDAYQGITEVVRGQDLVDNTPRQIYLQQLLAYTVPEYTHLPLVFNDDGQKLSALTLLGYPEELLRPSAACQDTLAGVIAHEKQAPILAK